MAETKLSEEEIRKLEAELERITVDDVLLQTVVSLINLGARKAGLLSEQASSDGEGAETDKTAGGVTPDYGQLRLAIDGARALLPILEKDHHDKLGPIKDTLSRLQMIYVQNVESTGASSEGDKPTGATPEAGVKQAKGAGETSANKASQEDPGPAQKSGRLWVPGQK